MKQIIRPNPRLLLSLAAILVAVMALVPSGGFTAAAEPAATPQAGGVTCKLYQPGPDIGKDAFIDQERPDDRKGGVNELRVKSENNKLKRSLLQFDLSTLPSGAVISSATLSLYVKSAAGGAVTINAHKVTASWKETEVTWKARDKAAGLLWASPGGDYNTTVVSSATLDDTRNVWRAWNLTTLAADWVANPADNFGVILAAAGGKAEKVFKSSEDGTASQRPKLEVCYTAGLTLTPDNSGDGVPGLTRTYAHVVRVGGLQTVVNLTAVSDRGWATRIYKDVDGDGVKDSEDTLIAATPLIGPNADYPILVQVDVPLSAASGTVDTTTVTATAQNGGATATATDRTRVGRQINVSPSHQNYATPGSTLFYGHTITNNGDAPDCMTVTATSSQGWTVYLWQDLNRNAVHETSNPNEPALSNPVCLQPGATYWLVAEVRVPAGAAAGTVDQTVIKAVSGNNPSTSGSAVDTTEVFINDPPVIDGKYDAIYSVSPDAQQVCYTANGTLFGKLASFYQPAGDAVYMVLAIDKDFVDNTYGTTAIGWPGGHKFGDLVGSDHAQFQGYDADGKLVLDIKQDYLTAFSGTPSGYDSLGVTGGDGKVILGSATNIKAWATSLDYNLNSTGYCAGGTCPGNLTVNSPATDPFYTPNPTYPAWIYDVIYEIKIDKAAFGAAGFGSLEVPYIHASPSKLGTNTIYAEPGICPGEIGDFVWKDLNADGIQDPGEPGIDGVQVRLYKDNGDGVFNPATDILMGTRTTSAGGKYLFQDLAPNDYFVDVVDSTVPAGYQTTTYNDPTSMISLGEGQSYLEADFGYVIGAVLGDFVWEDLDKDGIQDPGEPGIPGVTVNLYDGANKLLAATVTDNNGYYSFANRPAGSYQLEFLAPYGFVFSPKDQGGDDAKDSDADPTTGRTAVFTMASGVPDLTRDAGLYHQAPGVCDESTAIAANFNSTAIPAGSTLWFSSHLDNIVGLPAGQPVTLYFDQGRVQFTANSITYDLPVPRAKIIFSPSAANSSTAFDAATQTWVTTVAPGDTAKEPFLAGLAFTVPPGGLPANISPVTWTGRFTTDQPGITVGWQWAAAVYLSFSTDYSTLGVTPVDGAYQSGTPANYRTYVVAGARGNGGTNYTGDDTAVVNTTPCETAKIGDRVWNDANNNGVQDAGEPGLPGVTVVLYDTADNPVAIATTDANGLYGFTVPPGNYYLQFTPLAGYTFSPPHQGGDEARDSDADPATGRTPTTNLFYGENDTTWDAGMSQTASVGDKVWYDSNYNGIQDPDEPGVPDIAVTLFDVSNKYVNSDTTDANGVYGFTGLTPGTYYLVFSLPNGYVITAQNRGGDPARDSDPNSFGDTPRFTLAAGQHDPTWDAGIYQVSSLGDRVWYDANANGIQDAGEPGVANVTVELYDGAGTLIDTTATDADGMYGFENLLPGDYYVRFIRPAGAAFTRPDQGMNDAADSDADVATGETTIITLPPGQDDLTWDAGLVPAGAIGDFVWYDANKDGIEDVGEPGIGNVTLDLYLDGTLIASTVTDADGGYLFPGLPPGNYTVEVTDVYGQLDGLTHMVANQSRPNPADVTLSLGQIYKDADFGYVLEVSPGEALIGDTVWYDGNGDGIQQPGEPGIPGITVCATPTGGGPICAVTDANGIYHIVVPAGTYTVAPTNPPAGYTATTPTSQTVELSPGQQYLNADFGYRSPNLGAIGNLVFIDVNRNSIFDATDYAAAGVSVDLIRDTNGNKTWDPGEPIIATVTTASRLTTDGTNGNYLFSGLPSGNYLVHVSDVNGVLIDFVKSPLGAPDVNNNNQADPYPVSLPQGAVILTADFGYQAKTNDFGVPEGAIGNQVWVETDGNGLFNPLHGDFGQAGVTVELLKDNVPYGTTTTGASGRYAFLRLPAGNYKVVVSDLADVLAGYTVTALGPNPGQDNNNQAQPYAIVLPVDSVNWTADFGYIQPAAIGDYVWYDSNADGIQNVFEPGIGNVTIRLYRDNGDGILQVGVDQVIGDRVTGADGGYLFTGLTPGAYFVDVTDSQGMLGGMIHTLGPQSKPDPFGAIVLAGGQVYRDADFGYVQQLEPGNAVIGDTVWYDGDGDGLRDPGEPGIPGITVCATEISSGARFCDATNASGIYLIELPAGTYNVAPIDPPAGYTATTPETHGPVTVGPGESYLDADFGYDSPALGSIGGTVWRDNDGDGLLDPGEPRFPGVSVDLIRDDGDGVREPGEPVIATVTTDQNGDYLFQGLPPGNYLVAVSDTQNVLDDFMPTILGPNPGQDNNNQEQPYPINLLAGQNNTTADFGYVPERTDSELGIIGNQVWYETDGNGLYNPDGGDLGIAGVTVALYRGGNLYDTTTTGASGDYVFTSLPAGNYTVQVTDAFRVLSSYVLTVLGPNPGQDNNHQAQPYAITLPSAGINMTADFGYTRPGAIGDFVWYDASKDGIQDVGEPGIPNVTLDLYRNGIKIATTTTDADGGYLFAGLRPGDYTVQVTDTNARLTGLTHIIANQSLNSPTPVIRLAAGEVYKDADFGYVKITLATRAIIGDTVWYDANGDGIQQPGEPGIPGVTVCATPAGGGAPICSAPTDSNGYYRIEVPAGSYNVAPSNPPAGYTGTTPVPHPVTVVGGQTYLNADFGYDSPALSSIGNLVFLDKDRNGIYGAGDTALPGVSMSLIRDANSNGIWDSGEPIIATVTTSGSLDANTGNYLFPGVPAGRYLVHVSDTNAVLTDYIKSPLGTPNINNHNQADPYPVNLPTGSAILTADFGYFQADRPDVGVIGNQVWIEKDANGVFNPDGSDFGQPGVTVELYRNGAQYDTTVTGASGDYSFIGLPAGTYSVTVTDDFSVLALYVVTVPGPNQGSDNNNQIQPYTVALATGGYNLTADFGYTAPKSSIGDTVFFDDNRSGAQDGTEQGIPGILVQLYAQNQAGACSQLLDSRITDNNGKYLFANLAPGNYCVVVPENNDNSYLATFERTAGPNPHKVSLAAEQHYLDADFGYAGRGPIQGIVYYDWNENGVRDPGEDGIPNVTVCLFEDLDRDGVRDSNTPIACTTTNDRGGFSFENQLPGSYLVEQSQPGGLSSTTPNVIQANLQLTQGQGFSDGNDFGEILKVRLGDFVYVDQNNNYQPDPGEPGIHNVQIRITGTNILGQAVDVTVTTVGGLYYGVDLLPGTYTATAPPFTGPYILHTPPNRSTTLTLTFTEDLTLDFGYVTPTSVSIQAFTAASAAGKVNLTWNILGLAPDGFRLWRAENAEGKDLMPVNGGAAVLGDADTGVFRYTDETVTVGVTYWYWLEDVATGERFGPTSVTVQPDVPPLKRVFLPFVLR